MPAYLLRPLCDYLPALEAADLRRAVTAATAPHVKQHDYRSLLWTLDAQMRPLYPPPPDEPAIEHVEEDRDKAAAWFAEQGVKVVSSG